jgi:uncharacterized protein (TIGR02284 family)
MATTVTDELHRLMKVLVDSRNGYQEAVEKVEGPVASTMVEMLAMRDHHVISLRQDPRLADDGAASGSILSTVHKAVVDLRALVPGIDKNIMPGVIDGEERILKHYDDVVALMPGTDRLSSVLAGQRAKIVDMIAALRKLAPAS